MLRMIGVIFQPLIINALIGLVSYNLFTQEPSVSVVSELEKVHDVRANQCP